jgi:hypothetical protein
MTSGVSQPSDAERDLVALRLLLKTALRAHGLRCVGIRKDGFTTTPEVGPLGD